MKIKTANKRINADRFYTPLRFTALCIKTSGYASRYIVVFNKKYY